MMNDYPTSADQIKCVVTPIRYIRAGEKLLMVMAEKYALETARKPVKQTLWKRIIAKWCVTSSGR